MFVAAVAAAAAAGTVAVIVVVGIVLVVAVVVVVVRCCCWLGAAPCGLAQPRAPPDHQIGRRGGGGAAQFQMISIWGVAPREQKFDIDRFQRKRPYIAGLKIVNEPIYIRIHGNRSI